MQPRTIPDNNITSTPADGVPQGQGSGLPEGRQPARDNHALLLYSSGASEGTCPAQFLELDRGGAAVAASSRPQMGEIVSVCQVDPDRTSWILATVVGFELANSPPYHLELAFRSPLGNDILDAIVNPESESGGAPALDVPPQRRRVLVVDDHDQTRNILARLFRNIGYHVDVASTLEEALSFLDPAPGCIVLDLMLPDGPGEAILSAVRALGLSSRVAICTGSDDPGRLKQIEGLLPHVVLRKPIKFDDVVRVCEAIAC